MTSIPRDPSRSDLLSTKLGVVRELALHGTAGPARQLCGSVLLDDMMLLVHDEALLKDYVECLLLLEQTALLRRVFQAIYGVAIDMAPLTGSGRRRWRVTLSNGVSLAMTLPGLRADSAVRAQAAERWSTMIMLAASRDGGGEAAPSPRQSVLDQSHRSSSFQLSL